MGDKTQINKINHVYSFNFVRDTFAHEFSQTHAHKLAVMLYDSVGRQLCEGITKDEIKGAINIIKIHIEKTELHFANAFVLGGD